MNALKEMMNFLTKHLTINRDFIFVGQKKDLNNKVKASGMLYEFIGDNEIAFFSRVSFGTLGLGFRIKVKLFVSSADSQQLKIKFTTGIRPEHYVTILLVLVFIISYVLGHDIEWTIIFLPVIWISAHLWFQFIFRLQEDSLLSKVSMNLKLKEV
jgi:hypothetical protein